MTRPVSPASDQVPFYRRFGVKVVAAFMTLTLAALGASAYTSVRIAGDGFARIVSQDFQSTLSFSENYLSSSGRGWSNWVRHLTIDEHEHGLGEVLLTKDRAAIEQYINDHLPSIFTGAATVLDVNGRVMYRALEPGEYGDSLNHIEIVRNALAGGNIDVAIVNDLNRFMLYAAAPVYAKDKLAGALLIGSAIDDAFVDNIKGKTGVELAVVRDRAVMGSTLTDDAGLAIGDLPIAYLEYQMMLSHPGQVQEMRFLGQRYFVATQKLEMMDGNTPGSLFLAVPRKRLDETEAEIYRKFLYLMSGVTILTLIIGGVISHRLSSPLAQLTEKANAIAEGITDAKFHNLSKNEFGVLAASFNTMQDSIRNKNEKLRAYSANLENKVKERTAELEQLNAQFLSAKESAEEANHAKSLFLSSMSHELRTPLNAVLGFGQMLTFGKNKLTEDQADAVNQILKGGEHLLGLINEVLDLAGIESGVLKLDVVPVAPAKSIKQCLLMTESMAAKYDVEVQTAIHASDLPMINVDLLRFRQVLLNLLSNAVKYNRPKGSVTLMCDEAADGMLRFNVTDTGEGIPEDMQDRLFTPFERMGREASNIEGTGIGLNITKELVELMEGRIGFRSQVGTGSTFWVEFPITGKKPFKEPVATGGDDHMAEPQNQAPGGRKYSILYVEDNPANLDLMEKLIDQLENVELRTAQDAELGLAMAQGDHPDLILMDIHLPGMDGVEALRVLKSSGETAHIPVLAISADAMPESIDKATDEGFEGYITKPFNLLEVKTIILDILDHSN